MGSKGYIVKTHRAKSFDLSRICGMVHELVHGVDCCEHILDAKGTGKSLLSSIISFLLTLKVLVATIDAQWEGMGDVGSARYEPALLHPCPTIRVLTYSN